MTLCCREVRLRSISRGAKRCSVSWGYDCPSHARPGQLRKSQPRVLGNTRVLASVITTFGCNGLGMAGYLTPCTSPIRWSRTSPVRRPSCSYSLVTQ